MTISFVNIDTSVDTQFAPRGSQHSIVVCLRVSSNDHLWVFYIDSVADLVWQKSTNGGATWGGKNTIDGTETWEGVSIWFDRWTPGDTTGNTIHIIAVNSNLDLATYFTLGVDDDTAEADNDVDIVATVGAVGASPQASICKGTDDDLYVSWNVTDTATGTHIYRSDDSGTTWGSIYGRTEWSVDANEANDRVELIPLLTDDDILAVFSDDTEADIYSIRYDGTATDASGWDASNTTMKLDILLSDPTIFQNVNCTVDDNGDVYCIFLDGVAPNGQDTEVMMRVYDESAGTWGSDNIIYDNIFTTGNGNEPNACTICWDSIDNCLFALFIAGDEGIGNNIYLTQSFDLGITWGTPVEVSQITDDYKGVWMPTRILDTNNNLPVLFFNSDFFDLINISGGVEILRKTGTVKDNAGVAVTTCDCKFFKIQTGSHMNPRLEHIFEGIQKTDGSGNWSVPLVDHHNDTPEFQIIYDDDLANDETDASRRFST